MTLGPDQVLPRAPCSFVTLYIARYRERTGMRERQRASPGCLETEMQEALALVILFCLFWATRAGFEVKNKPAIVRS